MTQYLLNMYQPDGVVPPPEVLEPIMRDLAALNDEMQEAGAFVFTVGLHPASAATVLRAEDGDVVTTDGPFVEAKEHLGGFWLVEAADRDEALRWSRRIVEVTGLPIEVRPVARGPAR